MSADEHVPEKADWTYDAEAGAGYLSLRPGRITSSEAAGELLVVDCGQGDETLGIEVLSSEDAALIDAWLAQVKRDAALHEKQRIAGEVRLWASVNDDLGYIEAAETLTRAANDIDRIPEETP